MSPPAEAQRKIFYLEQDPLPASAGVLETGPDLALLSERRLVLRVTALLLRRFSQQVPPQVTRVFLRRLLCVRDDDGPEWLRVYSLEVLRGVCLDVPLLKSLADPRAGGLGGGPARAGGGNLLAEMAALLGKVAIRACDPNAPVRAGPARAGPGCRRAPLLFLSRFRCPRCGLACLCAFVR